MFHIIKAGLAQNRTLYPAPIRTDTSQKCMSYMHMHLFTAKTDKRKKGQRKRETEQMKETCEHAKNNRQKRLFKSAVKQRIHSNQC